MEKRKLIVSFENNISPKNVLRSSSLGASLELTRLYEIDDVVQAFRSNNTELAGDDIDDEVLFNEEIFFQLSKEEQNVYSTFVSSLLPMEEAQALFDDLEDNEFVRFVQFDEENTLEETPEDPYYDKQWGLIKTDAERAWKYSLGEEVIVAVVDTGVDYNNSDIEPNLWKSPSGHYGYDFASRDTDTMDYSGHGTHVAGIIAAIHNQNQLAGVAPKATIMPVKIFPKAYDSVAAKGIKYATDNGARVINNSWGPRKRRSSNRVVEEMIDYSYSKNVVNVFAAGNQNDNIKYYSPKNHPNVIVVGSTTSRDARSSFSNYGEGVQVCAPGSSILSLALNSDTPVYMSGTSMAAPFVSGAAALILSINPETTSTETLLIKITKYSDKISTDKKIGKRLNIGKIVFNDPANFKLFEKIISNTHRGVKDCCSKRQSQARKAATKWQNAVIKKHPNLNKVYSGHGAGTAKCSSGRRGDNSRWCKTTVRFRAYIMMRK